MIPATGNNKRHPCKNLIKCFLVIKAIMLEDSHWVVLCTTANLYITASDSLYFTLMLGLTNTDAILSTVHKKVHVQLFPTAQGYLLN